MAKRKGQHRKRTKPLGGGFAGKTKEKPVRLGREGFHKDAPFKEKAAKVGGGIRLF